MRENLEPVNAADLRRAFGCFATGVTVITSRSLDGVPIGVTASSFTSVSLAPPLLLVSLSHRLRSLPALRDAGHFTVNILGASQQMLAETFANAAIDKWHGVACEPGPRGAPVIDEAVAVFECETESIVPAGDHDLYLGRIVKMSAAWNLSPLVFHGGRFTTIDGRDAEARQWRKTS
jgi:flavin reductase (DIM6/NTAB) family NADH-FMN oxidoreductase RutF